MNWFKDIISKLQSKKHVTNYNSGKSFEERYNDLGVFQYDSESFTITHKDFSRRIKWDDVIQINAYKRDQITIDRIEMEIVFDDKYFTISEDLPGWYQFILKTKEIYPRIPKDWDIKIIQPAFTSNFTTIYDKTQLNINK
ncbi:MAG: hypothetical protein HYR91_12905 [Flavobacteriia bacterium]|nr:hypothetical protein [Flavobacteriia bacterium]